MQVKINGQEREVEAQTVQALLRAMGMERPGVAVEVNREVVPAAAYASTPVREGDEVEIVSLVGGG